MAYLRSLKQTCIRCAKPATVELVDFRNERRGVFCAKCGDRALKERNNVEKAMFAKGNV